MINFDVFRSHTEIDTDAQRRVRFHELEWMNKDYYYFSNFTKFSSLCQINYFQTKSKDVEKASKIPI